MPQPKDWLDKLFTRTTPNDKELLTHYGWQQGDTAYEWYGNGMLKSVCTPEGATIRFEYDALGRRTLKETHDVCHRYAWDGNVLLHEWSYDRREKPRMEKDELGRIRYDRQEPHTNLITWVYDGGSYTPVAKLTEEDSYTIVQDYLGTPIQALDSKGNVVWDCILDIYGDVLELRGERYFIPFRFQGQYEDEETGLYYNRFRYYDPNTGSYISQDPIGLAGGNPTMYGYVFDNNIQLDIFGLKCKAKHHPIPKFLGGNKKQDFSELDDVVHKEYHSLLNKKLKQNGLPLPDRGPKGSAALWDRYMASNPGSQRKAFDAVLDAAREIDFKHGTDITSKFWQNIYKGNFKVHP